MLERNQFGPADVQRFYPTERERDFIKFADIKLFLRRYAPFIGSFAAAGPVRSVNPAVAAAASL